MKEIIQRLKSLNKLDVRMQALKKDMERLPRELAEKQNGPKLLRGTIERSKADVLRLKLEADGIELEVKSGEEALKRLATQMNVLRTSKEFETVKRQMDAQRAWNKENEGKALELLELIDARQKEIEKNNQALAEAEKRLSDETLKVNAEIAQWKAEYDQLLKEREELAREVPDKELLLYNRVASVRGQAIATVDRGICSACYMKIPAQVHNLALLAKELVVCPSCGRVLTTA